MIIYFLPGAATCSPFLRRLGEALEAVSATPVPSEQEQAQETAAATASPWAPPPSDPMPAIKWSVQESNEVYVAAVGVAKAIFDMHRQNDSTGVWDTSMRVLEKAREVATLKHLDHRQMVAGLTDVEKVIRQTIVEDWGDYSEGWWNKEAAQAGRLLWLATSVDAATQEMREKLQAIYGAPRKEQGPVSAAVAAGEFIEGFERELAGLGPVNIVNDHVVVTIRPEGPEWAIDLKDIPSPTRLLKYVADLTSKRWATCDMISKFVSAVCSTKGWSIYDFSPEHSQERA